MKTPEQNKSNVISIIKEYIAPSLISLVGLFIWRDITDMRSDIKLLLIQQSADKVKIEAMQNDIAMLKSNVFSTKTSQTYSLYPQPAKKEDELEIK